MRLQKVVFLVLLPFVSQMLIACLGCGDPPIRPFAFCSFSVFPLDNSGPQPVISQTGAIPKNAFGIRLHFNLRQYMCEAKQPVPAFFPAAFASTSNCNDVPYATYQHAIEQIQVYTLHDFGPGFAANANVTELFYVYRPEKHQQEFTAVQDFINQMPGPPYNSGSSEIGFNLLLMTPPETGTGHEFLVNVLLTNGSEFTAQTGVLELVP